MPDLNVEIYPREGTETFQQHEIIKNNKQLKFIPARGRKPNNFFEPFSKFIVEIYLREGTETR